MFGLAINCKPESRSYGHLLFSQKHKIPRAWTFYATLLLAQCVKGAWPLCWREVCMGLEWTIDGVPGVREFYSATLLVSH